MPYKDPEKQREAIRAASARWYQTRRDDPEFLEHRAENARRHTEKTVHNQRLRRAQEREADVYAALSRLKSTITPNQQNETDETEEHLSADDNT